ncbi:MAG: proteasome accessory factor [Actinomycetota bacterium]|nr:proteasome accessory factor [Actinomycetota bacterium]
MADRLERLLNLTAALLDASMPLSIDDIRARVPGYPEEAGETFRRAFERDKDSLRHMGIPLRVEEIPGSDPPLVGYRIRREEYALADPGLEPDELAALNLAVATVQVDGFSSGDAIRKLGGGAESGDIAVDLPSLPTIGPLFAACASGSVVEFRHNDKDRVVDPYRLTFQRGRWYLDGREHTSKEPRSYRLDRIEGEVRAGPAGGFERKPLTGRGMLPPWEMGAEPPMAALLRVDADQAPFACDTVGAEHVVVRHDDGAVDIMLTVSNRDAFRSFVLGFLEHAEVLSPPELRDDMVHWLTSIAERTA